MKNLFHFIAAVFVLPFAVLSGSMRAGDNPGRWLTVVAQHDELFTGLGVMILLLTIRAFEKVPGTGSGKVAVNDDEFSLPASDSCTRRTGKE